MTSILTIGFVAMLTLLAKSLLLDDDVPCHERAETIR